MSKSKPPKPSQAEIALQQQQTAALASQTRLLEEQARRQEQQYQEAQKLQPLLYEQMGLRPQYEAGTGRLTGYERFETPEQALYKEQIETMRRQQPLQERLQEQYLTLAEQQAAYQREQADWQRELAPQMRAQAEAQTRLQGQMTAYQEMALKQYQDQQRLQPLLYEASGVRPIYDEEGNITSFILTEEAQARKDYENQLLEHQRKALAGELPVDPTLERTLAEGETQLRAQLQAQLGTGYETSTPGIQALAEFSRRAAEARSNVAHGQLTSGQQLLATQTEMNQRMRGQATSGRGMLGEFGLRPVEFGPQVQANAPGLFQAGSPASRAAGYQAAAASPYGTLGQFGDLASRYGQLVQGGGNLVTQLSGQRERGYQQYMAGQDAYAGQWGQIGAAVGTAAGAAIGTVVPVIGTAAGAAAGGTLGSFAGQYGGRAMY